MFDENGEQIARHRKIHLFDVDIEGGVRFKESNSFAPGEDITVFDTKFGRMGVEICFDIRFPELARALAKRGAEVHFVPCAVQYDHRSETLGAERPRKSYG